MSEFALKIWSRGGFCIFYDQIEKKVLRVFGVMRRTPFTGGAEVLLGRSEGSGCCKRGEINRGRIGGARR